MNRNASRALAARDPESIVRRGVSLSTFVRVHASIARGAPLTSVLAAEGISIESWLDVDTDFAHLLADDAGEDLALVDLHDRLLIEHQDASPSIAGPLADDLGVFLRAVRHVGESVDPVAVLDGLGVTGAAFAQLVRRWGARLASDASLRERAAVHLAEDPAAPPPPPPARPWIDVGVASDLTTDDAAGKNDAPLGRRDVA